MTRPPTAAPRIEVTIDRVVVHGLPPGDARAAATALREHVATLAADALADAESAAPQWAARARGEVEHDGDPATLGRRVAAATMAAVLPRAGRDHGGDGTRRRLGDGGAS